MNEKRIFKVFIVLLVLSIFQYGCVSSGTPPPNGMQPSFKTQNKGFNTGITPAATPVDNQTRSLDVGSKYDATLTTSMNLWAARLGIQKSWLSQDFLSLANFNSLPPPAQVQFEQIFNKILTARAASLGGTSNLISVPDLGSSIRLDYDAIMLYKAREHANTLNDSLRTLTKYVYN